MPNLKRSEKPKTLLPIKSSWLTGGHYDPETKTLTVGMTSGTYECTGVPQAVYDGFAATFQAEESSGKYFGEHIKKYPAKKVV